MHRRSDDEEGNAGCPDFSNFLEPFTDHEPLYQRVLKVLNALPQQVQQDFLLDSRFHVTLENRTGTATSTWMPAPGPMGSESRCVVLRLRLADSVEAFACYVIAHEFAHAFLRNGGWGDIADREEAADALAASWGFHKPTRGGFLRSPNS
jgi:hypothetical protein